MESNRARSFGQPSYEEFQARTEWLSDETSETLYISLPGFSKEQLKVQMDNMGNLRVSGERPLDAVGRRWSRFKTELPIPQSWDVRGVRARFDNNILSIKFPKLITEEPKPTVPPTPTPKPEPEPMPEPEKKSPVPEQKQEPETQKKQVEDVKEKENEEKEQTSVGHDGKEKEDGEAESAEAAQAAEAPVPEPAPEKMGIVLLKGIRRPKQLVVNMFVAVIVIVVIGMYVGYKLRSGGWGEWGKRRIVQLWRYDL